MYQCKIVDESFLSTAKVRAEATRELAVSASQLFASFEDGPAWTRWVPVIKHVEWTSPVGPGATRMATLIGGIKLDEVFWAWEPERRMGFRITATSNPALVALLESYDVTPLGEHRCRLHWRMGMELKGPLKLIEPYMGRSLPGAMQKLMQKLERVAASFPGARNAA